MRKVFIMLMGLLFGLAACRPGTPRKYQTSTGYSGEFNPKTSLVGTLAPQESDQGYESVWIIQRWEERNEDEKLYYLSPNGQDLAFLMDQGNGKAFVTNGQEGKTYQSIQVIRWSEDRKHFAYVASQKLEDASIKYRVVVDNSQEFPLHEQIFDLKFFQNGKSVHYVAQDRDATSQKRLALFLDGREIYAWNSATETVSTVLSDEGNRIALLSRQANQASQILWKNLGDASAQWNKMPSAGFGTNPYVDSRSQAVVPGYSTFEYPSMAPSFAPRTGTLAWVEEDAQGDRVYIEGKAQKNYDAIETFRWSPEGKHWAMVVMQDKKQILVFDGQEEWAAEKIEDLSFSPDGSCLAYVERNQEQECLILDRKKLGCYDKIRGLTFSHSGKHFAFIVKEEREQYNFQEFVVADGKAEEPLKQIYTLQFSPHDEQLLYLGAEQEGHGRLILFWRGMRGYLGPFFTVHAGEMGRRLEQDFGWSLNDRLLIYSEPRRPRVWWIFYPSDRTDPHEYQLRGTRYFPLSLLSQPQDFSLEEGSMVQLREGKEEVFDWIGEPRLSPHGTMIGYNARIGNQIWWIAEPLPIKNTEKNSGNENE